MDSRGNIDLLFERFKEVARETAYSTLGFIIPGTTISTAKAVTESTISKKFHNDMDNMKATVEETKTQQRSPDHSEQFMDTIGMNKPVYISPEGIELLYQENKKEDVDALLKKAGVNPDRARSTAAAGQDVEVKQSKALSQLNQEEYNKISKDIKPAPSAYTAREIQQKQDAEDVENAVKILVEENQKDAAVNQEIVRIKDEAGKAKLDKETVENAPVLLKGLADRLSLEGVDPVEFLKKVGFKRGVFAEIKDFLQPGKRGGIPVSNESHLISLFEDADMSTVLHEVGHIALKEYSDLETTGQASDQLKSDMTVIRQWVGAEKGADLTRDQSETFARGFEAYLMEGKAPTAELRTAFERFKRWLVNTYRTAKGLDVKLNKNVRSVFDRMLSASIEVEAAAQTGGFQVKTIEEMNRLGVPKDDQVFANKLIEDMTFKAERKLTQARNKGYRENVKTWRIESDKELRAENPTYDLIDIIVKENNKIDRDDFIDRYGKDAIILLPDNRILVKDGKSLDEVAGIYEFDDFTDMVNDFFETQNLQDATVQRVNQKQAAHDAQWTAEDFLVGLKEYRDYLDIMSKNIAKKDVDQAAVEAGIQRNLSRWETEAAVEISNEFPDLEGNERDIEVTDRVQEKMEKFRQRKALPGVISQDTLKALAKETINAKSVREARQQHKFMGAIKKAASAERRAILRGDWGEASRQNEIQRFNYEMATLSRELDKEVKTILDRSKRIGKSKADIDGDHKEAILHLISRYNLASLVPNNPGVTPKFNVLFAGDKFISDNDFGNDFGNDGFPTPDFLFENSIKDFRDLSMEQMRELDSAIRYLDKRGRDAKRDTLSDGETLVQDKIDETVAVMEPVKIKKVWEKGSLMRRLSDTTRKFFARLDSLNFIAKSLDGYTNLGKDGVKGPVETMVDWIKDSENGANAEWRRIRTEIEPHINQISKTIRKWHFRFGNKIKIEGVPVPQVMREDGQTTGWKSDQIFAVVLNTGNTGDKSNFQNLLAGYPDLTPGMIEQMKDMLSTKDMDAVQGIWDIMESLYPKANDQHVKLKGYNMPKVEATPFTFKGKNYRGGYYPIRHDRNLSYQVDDQGKIEDLFNNDAAQFTAPYTKKGNTIQRKQGVKLPVLLNLSPIDRHFRDTVQYIHYTDAIRDFDRVSRSADFRKAATRILGKDVYDTIRPALGHIANPTRPGLDTPGARGIEWMRGLSTAYILAWNTGVALKQPLSTFGAIRDMGIRAYMDGFSSTLAAPAANYHRMLDLSDYMRNRLKAWDRELRSEFNKLSPTQRGIYFGDNKVTWQDVKNFGYWQIRLADTVTVVPIWNGAFNDKLNADQSNLDEAIRYADDIVRNSQPSAAPLDLSSWQRDGGVLRLFSQFQTFTVGKYGQRQRLFYRAWKNGSISTLDYAWFNFMDAIVPLVAINFLQAFLWGEDVTDDEVLKEKAINVATSWLFMGVPLASNVIRSVTGYGDPIDSPVITTANKLTRGVINGTVGLGNFKSKKEREKALWNLAHVTSILAGVPVDKMVSRAMKGAKAKEAAPGIRYLVPPPRKKR